MAYFFSLDQLLNRPIAAAATAGLRSRIPAFAAGAVIGIAIVKLLLHLYAARFYGYFVDELYFIACSDHLSWGYVDQPPLIAAIVKLECVLFGDSLQSIRLGSALAGAATVILGGMIVRELGGRRFAQALTALAVLCAPLYLAMDHYISMNAFEPVFWMVCALLVLRFINTDNEKLWFWFGLVAGIGLNNKYSMAFFAAGIVLGLLLTPHRRVFLRPWIWLGGLTALGLILPNLLWNKLFAPTHSPRVRARGNSRITRGVFMATKAKRIGIVTDMLPNPLSRRPQSRRCGSAIHYRASLVEG